MLSAAAPDAEGDAIGYECAQAANIVNFANMVRFGKPLAGDVRRQPATDLYLNAGTCEGYHGGLRTMMPWAGAVHNTKTVR